MTIRITLQSLGRLGPAARYRQSLHCQRAHRRQIANWSAPVRPAASMRPRRPGHERARAWPRFAVGLVRAVIAANAVALVAGDRRSRAAVRGGPRRLVGCLHRRSGRLAERLEPVRHVHSRDGRLFRFSVFPVLSCFFSSNSARCLAVITTSRASPLGADIGPGIVASSL